MIPAGPEQPTDYSISKDKMATIVIFGATGDLAGRKLIPAIYNLWQAGYLPERIAVVGVARKPKTDNEFREEMCDALKKHSRTGHGDNDACDPFVRNLYYHQINFVDDTFDSLDPRLDEVEKEAGLSGHRLFYLSVSPSLFEVCINKLRDAGLVHDPDDSTWTRVVVEKPFGQDLESARQLNAILLSAVDERQVYRIDHYLGKETVQNIFAFRFGNAVFEPLFNQRYVDHVQIAVAETGGMEGRRGPFYDETGALRDVVQNHGLQLLSIIAMEPPVRFTAKDIRDEKEKVLRSVRLSDGPIEDWCVRGQYTAGAGMPGYREEEGVATDSNTETYVALRLNVENWRWAGVPFYIRTGKAMKEKVTEIAIQFKRPPADPFRARGVDVPDPNLLLVRIQPKEAISLNFNSKPPGMAFDLEHVRMDFTYGQTFSEQLPEAYERLLLDAIRGDSTLFMRSDEIEEAWTICTEILERWQQAPPPNTYPAGTWGPAEADGLLQGCQGEWRKPSVD